MSLDESLEQIDNRNVRMKVEKFTGHLNDLLDEEILRSFLLIGSAVGPDYVPGVSDINSLLLVEETNRPVLDVIANLGEEYGALGFQAPILMTPEYLSASLDAFPLQFLLIRDQHVSLIGGGPFEDLTIDESDLRLQVEREVKGQLIYLQHAYAGAAGNLDRILEELEENVRELVPLVRGYLHLRNQVVSFRREEDLKTFVNQLEVDSDWILTLIKRAYDKQIPDPKLPVKEVYDHVHRLLGRFAERIDRISLDPTDS